MVITIRLLKGSIQLILITSVASKRSFQLRQSFTIYSYSVTADFAVKEGSCERTAQMSLSIKLAAQIDCIITYRQMLQINILGIHNKVQSAVGCHRAIQCETSIESIYYKILQAQQAVLISVMAADIIKQLLGGTAVGSMHFTMNIGVTEAALYLHSIIKITGNYIRLAHKHH